MITTYKKRDSISQSNMENEIELRGLSTDTKPTNQDNKNIVNGTIFFEMDTGTIYIYDLENNLWKEL